MTSRRSFMMSLLAASAAPRLGWAAAGSPAFLAAAQDPDGSFALYGLTTQGAQTFRVALPARGHAGAGHPVLPLAVAFARRPGRYALVIDCVTGRVLQELTPPDGRQFNGHGVFLADGATLATSEQMAATSEGRVGLWDSKTWARIGEVGTGGLGPHDLRLMPDGVTLVVANGGIVTDPTDRTKLNLPDMRPSLAYLTVDGGLTDVVEPDPALRQCSIRHLALRADGLVAFATQWEGDPATTVPLLGLHRQGGTVTMARTPEAEGPLMQGYAGSLAWSGDGTEVAITSPRGGRVQRFDDTGGFLGALARADVCGAASLPDGIITSDGNGALLAVRAGGASLLARHDCAWDNHIVALGMAGGTVSAT